MAESYPLLTSSSTILWLKVLLTALLLVLLCLRFARRRASAEPARVHSFGAKLGVVLAVLCSFAVFQSFGDLRGRTFVHYGEMFHYYLGPKYFQELGHYQLYNAVVAADAEQDGALSALPFLTDLKSYQNTTRQAALKRGKRIKKRFTEERWSAFKHDVAFFKKETGMPASPQFYFFLMDHGYNASPAATLVLGTLANIVPVTQLPLLASLDVLLVAAMVGLVFRTFGLLMGGLFSVYFFVNILNDPGYVSGSFLRYDWLFCIVAGVCLLERGKHALSALFLTAAAMLKVFPVVLFYGVGVSIFQKARAQRRLDGASLRFVVAAAVTAAALFILPAVYLGSVLRPWAQFADKTALHDRGVYVNHLGLRGVLLFEPSHLSLDSFVEKYKLGASADVVRNWQDEKEREFVHKRPWLLVGSLLVLACVTVIIWKRRAPPAESVLWPLPLIYMASYPSHYYYGFLSLFVLLFFRRSNSLAAFVPISLLLVFNLAALVLDSFTPSPIVFYSVVNLALFVCLLAMLVFELCGALRQKPDRPAASSADERRANTPVRSRNEPAVLRRVTPPLP